LTSRSIHSLKKCPMPHTDSLLRPAVSSIRLDSTCSCGSAFPLPAVGEREIGARFELLVNSAEVFPWWPSLPLRNSPSVESFRFEMKSSRLIGCAGLMGFLSGDGLMGSLSSDEDTGFVLGDGLDSLEFPSRPLVGEGDFAHCSHYTWSKTSQSLPCNCFWCPNTKIPEASKNMTQADVQVLCGMGKT
jgi:hypothetical protein